MAHDKEGLAAIAGSARVFDQGAHYRVTVSEDGIYEWRRRWPASGLSGLRGVSFVFDKKSGDLVDIFYANGNAERWDGPALVALSEDAQEYGRQKLAAAAAKVRARSLRGKRVELSPGHDLWMRGARYGTIASSVGDVVSIRMDHPRVKKLVKTRLADISFLDDKV